MILKGYLIMVAVGLLFALVSAGSAPGAALIALVAILWVAPMWYAACLYAWGKMIPSERRRIKALQDKIAQLEKEKVEAEERTTTAGPDLF